MMISLHTFPLNSSLMHPNWALRHLNTKHEFWDSWMYPVTYPVSWPDTFFLNVHPTADRNEQPIGMATTDTHFTLKSFLVERQLAIYQVIHNDLNQIKHCSADGNCAFQADVIVSMLNYC